MYCSKCGDKVDQNERYCNRCGNFVEKEINYLKSRENNSHLGNNNTLVKTPNNNVNNVNHLHTNNQVKPVHTHSNAVKLVCVDHVHTNNQVKPVHTHSNAVKPVCVDHVHTNNQIKPVHTHSNAVKPVIVDHSHTNNQVKPVQSNNNGVRVGHINPNLKVNSPTINNNNNNVVTKKKIQNDNNDSANNLKMLFAGVGIGIFILIVYVSLFGTSSDYYISDSNYNTDDEYVEYNDNNTFSKKGKYKTVIVTDNFYYNIDVDDDKDAYNIISKDSTKQKVNCPNSIKSIEEEIINKYGVTAVNLCEMDPHFAKEVGNVFKKVYSEYPSVRGHLTNLTLINAPVSQSYVAAFMPIFPFTSSGSDNEYPWVVKTQILLNTKYFLNPNRLESAVVDSSNLGHFPPNANIYSPVAHELGHYLSFIAMMRHYNLDSVLIFDSTTEYKISKVYEDFAEGTFSLSMIKEAYEKCRKDKKTTLGFDEWRATISSYAVAKDNSGNYIYDETVAEAFHDVYLNGENACGASKYIVSVLKGKLR